MNTRISAESSQLEAARYLSCVIMPLFPNRLPTHYCCLFISQVFESYDGCTHARTGGGSRLDEVKVMIIHPGKEKSSVHDKYLKDARKHLARDSLTRVPSPSASASSGASHTSHTFAVADVELVSMVYIFDCVSNLCFIDP